MQLNKFFNKRRTETNDSTAIEDIEPFNETVRRTTRQGEQKNTTTAPILPIHQQTTFERPHNTTSSSSTFHCRPKLGVKAYNKSRQVSQSSIATG